jgi:hypothetical protein
MTAIISIVSYAKEQSYFFGGWQAKKALVVLVSAPSLENWRGM